MNCSVIQDLLPLYADGCCSAESAKMIEEHIQECDGCKAALEAMRQPMEEDLQSVTAPKNMGRIHLWKASILQSVLFLVAFAILSIGVYLEAYTPTGLTNGIWAFTIVIPAVGFLLSLTNWYFVRLYKSRKSFTFWSFMITLLVTIGAFIFGLFHYDFSSVDGVIFGLRLFSYGGGALFTLLLYGVTIITSNVFAKMIGKE